MEAVLVSMSCFALLCEEAEIRCGSDEVAVTCLLPNYHLYLELAQASTVLITGEFDFLELCCYDSSFTSVRPIFRNRKRILVFQDSFMNV